MAEELSWTWLVFLGRRAGVTAWRVFESEGGCVLFLVPTSQLRDVILGLRLSHPLVGVDAERHAEMRVVLRTIGLGALAGSAGLMSDSAGEEES